MKRGGGIELMPEYKTMMKTESTGRREGFAATLLGTLALIAIAATGF